MKRSKEIMYVSKRAVIVVNKQLNSELCGTFKKIIRIQYEKEIQKR